MGLEHQGLRMTGVERFLGLAYLKGVAMKLTAEDCVLCSHYADCLHWPHEPCNWFARRAGLGNRQCSLSLLEAAWFCKSPSPYAAGIDIMVSRPCD